MSRRRGEVIDDGPSLEEQRPEVLPRLYIDADCRGYAQRDWAFEEWCRVYGHFDSIRITHGWMAWATTRFKSEDIEHCQIVTMHASLGCDHYREDCYCVGGTAYRGMCQYCDFEGEIRATDHEAWMDSADHAWPGWRDLPVLERPPSEVGTSKKALAAKAHWLAQVNALYPPGWVEQGGPIRTKRGVGSTAAIAGGTGFGGFDLPGEIDYTDCHLSRGQVRCPGLDGCIAQNWTCEREDWL